MRRIWYRLLTGPSQSPHDPLSPAWNHGRDRWNGGVVVTSGDMGQTSGARPSFDEALARSRAVMQRIERMRTEADQVSVTGTSPDGSVTVTVNSGGVPTDLRITDKALELTGAQVAATVMATMRQAQARLANRMNEVLRDTLGDDTETVDRVLAVYRDRFPEPESDEPPHSAPKTEIRFDTPDDWDGESSIMKRS